MCLSAVMAGTASPGLSPWPLAWPWPGRSCDAPRPFPWPSMRRLPSLGGCTAFTAVWFGSCLARRASKHAGPRARGGALTSAGPAAAWRRLPSRGLCWPSLLRSGAARLTPWLSQILANKGCEILSQKVAGSNL